MLYCALIFHCQKNCEVGLLCVLQFVTDKYIEQLRILEKAINQHNEGSLDAKYMVYDDITEKPDMQQQSDDAMKANSKNTEEKMVITCRVSSFRNEFLQQEHIGNERISIIVPIFGDRLKRFYLPTILLWKNIMQNRVTKNESNEKFENLPIRKIFAGTNINAQAEEHFKMKKYSLRLNENINIVEFLRLNFLDNLGIFRTSVETFLRELPSLKSNNKKKFSEAQQLCDNMLIGQDEESKITEKTKYQVLLVKMKVK